MQLFGYVYYRSSKNGKDKKLVIPYQQEYLNSDLQVKLCVVSHNTYRIHLLLNNRLDYSRQQISIGMMCDYFNIGMIVMTDRLTSKQSRDRILIFQKNTSNMQASNNTDELLNHLVNLSAFLKVYQPNIILSSELIVKVQHGEVSDFQGIRTHKDSILVLHFEVLHSFHLAVAVAVWLVQGHPHIEARTEVYHTSYKGNGPSSAAIHFTPGSNRDCACEFSHEIGVQLVCCQDGLFLLEKLWVFLDHFLLPLAEIFRQFFVVFLTDDVLFHSLETLYFLMDGRRVQVDHIQHHACSCPVGAQCAHILGQISKDCSLGVLQLEAGECCD